MKFPFPLSLTAFVTLAVSLVGLSGAYSEHQAQMGWNGITPLRSTRSDVENRLGKPTTECHCAYSTANESVVVVYSTGYCKGPPYGWNVPADTVLEVTVLPKQKISISESELLQQGYVREKELDSQMIYYVSVPRGIKYAVSDVWLNGISYMPSSNDIGLRCPGFPPYEGGLREYEPYAAFSSKAQFINERLYEFGAQLEHNPGIKGYIITYAGQVAKEHEAQMMADSAKRRLTEAQHISADRIILIDGGFREAAEYELFLVPNDMPPPAPTPSIATNQVRIVRFNKRRKINKKGQASN